MNLITRNHVAMMTRTTTITKKTIRMRYDNGDNGDGGEAGDDEDDEDNDDSDHLMSTTRMGTMSTAETNTGPFAWVWEVIRRV